MSDLLNEIRSSLRDRNLSQYELARLVDTAAKDGVSVDELNTIVSACEGSADGFSPELYARLQHQLTKVGATEALTALATKKPASEGWHKLAGRQATVELRLADVGETRNALAAAADVLVGKVDAEALKRGELTPLPTATPEEFALARKELTDARAAFFKAMVPYTDALKGLSPLEREALVAGGDSGTLSFLDELRKLTARPEVMAGAPASDKALLVGAFPTVTAAPKDGKSASFLDIKFSEPVAWTFDPSTATLVIPDGTTFKSLGELGNIAIHGNNLRLPGGATLDGEARLRGGQVALLNSASTYTAANIRLTGGNYRSQAMVRQSKDTLVAGPGARFDMPVQAAPAANTPEAQGVTLQKLKFALTESMLPDGTKMVAGRGEMTVMVKDGKPLAVVEGSIKLDAGATIEKEGAVPFVGFGGQPGELKRGMVVLKDGKPIGFGSYSEVLIDGITIETGSDQVSYRFTPPNGYELGAGVTVKNLPTDREVKLIGPDGLRFEGGPGRTVLLEKGAISVLGNRVTGLAANSVAQLSWGKVDSGDAPLSILEATTIQLPRGNSIRVAADRLDVRGSGVAVSGTTAEGDGLLRVRDKDTFARGERLSVTTGKEGSASVERKEEPGLPSRLEVTLAGDATFASGRWTVNAKDAEHPVVVKDNLGGAVAQIRAGKELYEIDPRPMWQEEGVSGNTGRFRLVPNINSQLYFGGAVAKDTQAILDGKKILKIGAKGEIVKRVQQVLNIVLNRTQPTDSTYSMLTATAVTAFQRLAQLPQTGVIDAKTMSRLDGWAPTGFPTALDPVTPRPKTMVMMWMNSDVPDERKRFLQLAEERHATPVVIGPADGDFRDPNALGTLFARAEKGEIDLDWLVISGHSGGSSTWGANGSLSYSVLNDWAKTFPRAAGEIEKLQLLNCYNVTRERVESLWKPMFPNVTGMGGFMYSAPGKNAQSSDENLLYTGRDLMRIPKGTLPDQSLANEITNNYVTNRFIKPQNASIWLRYSLGGQKEGETFKLTPSAEYEMRKHGSGDELSVQAFAQRQSFQKYLAATEPGFELPPAARHTGPLREYLNAVDGVLGRWLRRVQEYHAYEQRQARDPSFQMPEEYRNSNPEWQVSSLQKERAQVLFLIDFTDVVHLFDQKYAGLITAFNKVMADNKLPERFPTGDALKAMNRKQVLEMLGKLDSAMNRLPSDVADKMREGEPAWQLMVGTDPAVTQPASPRDFVRRASKFLKELDVDVIKVEWL